MTLAMATMEADEILPNAYTEEQKAGWISELDGKICAEVLKTPNAAPIAYRPEDGADRVLLVPFPYDNIYCLYLCAMIDYYNQEWESYENAMLMFRSAYGEYVRAYRRAHVPQDARYKNIM
ncbi:MAG: hypothetical protein RR365_11925 [Bacteroides sp.]